MKSIRSIVRILATLSLLCATTVAWLPTAMNRYIRVEPYTRLESSSSYGRFIQQQSCSSSSRRRTPGVSLGASIVAEDAAIVSEKISESSSQAELVLTEGSPTSTIESVDLESSSSLLSLNEDEFTVTQQVINAVFLAISFGYVIYQIFNIDQGMTRGWTGGEIAMRIPLDNWGAYESYLANKPIMTKTLINVIIYLLGDWLSQTAFQGKNVLHFDIKRTLKNGLIGLCFGPIVHEYYQFSDSILPPEDGLIVRLQKILMDQTIYLGIKCSVYISAVGLLNGDDWDDVQQTVKDRIGGVMITAWKFWPLVHCITYGLIPARHRILWVNSVDLVWNAILATMASKDEVAPEEEAIKVSAAAVALDSSSKDEKQEQKDVVVLDNQSIEDAKLDVVDMIFMNNNKSTNTTMDGVAPALGTVS